jgi:glycosyltransferase involved in cell wall biosynthesis
MADVSIVIRCCNEGRHIGRLLDGIRRQTVRPVEVVVVDSGSTDDTLEVAARHGAKLVHIPPAEFSFGRSLNRGCAAARGERLVIASAHVYPVCHDWLERLLAPLADPRIGLAYGRQRGNEVTKYSERQVFATWFGPQSRCPQETPFCNNANAAIRRRLWEELPYDEGLTGLEDLDWARRAMARGHHVAYAADAEVVHVHDETWGRIRNRYRREAIALKRIYPDAHFTLWDFARLLSANVASDCYHAWHDGALRRNLLAIPAFRLMQFWGTYRGFAQRGPVTARLKARFYYPRPLRRPHDESPESRRLIRYDPPEGPRRHAA